MIEKKIHYIWLGGKQKSKLTEICINSWKRVLPDYEIIEWNENNLEIEELCKENRFFKKCYELKLWAFVSDYVRLYVLYKYGGIYLDTDVEVLKSYNPLLNDKVFMGYEVNDFVGTAVIGAEKNNPIIKRLLEFYDDEIWNVDFINNPIIFKYLLEREPDKFSDCKLYPQNYFSPYEPNHVYDMTVEELDTYSIHWYTQNWNMSKKGYVFINTKHIKCPIKKGVCALKKNLGYLKRKYVKRGI